MLRFGVGLFPSESAARLRELTQLAESLGYDNAWFGDSQNIWREAYVTIATAAAATHRITLGTAVTNAVTRHESVLASAWATLSELTNGRVVLGIGAGDSSLRTMGMTPMRLADFEASVLRLRALLAGEPVTESVSGAKYHLAYVGGEPRRVPIYVAASNPNFLRLAGRVADGAILAVGADPGPVRAALAQLQEGAREAGRSLTDLRIVLWIPVSIAHDSRIAKDLAKPHVASVLMQPRPVEIYGDHSAAIQSIRQKYDYFQHMQAGPEVAQLVPDSLVDLFALAGTPAECRTRLEALAELPIDQLAIIPEAGPGRDRSETIKAFATIMKEMR